MINRLYFLLLSLLFPVMVSSQQIYHSQVTQSWPTIFTTDFEAVQRLISLEENAIVISSANRAGKEIETFYIKEINDDGTTVSFDCRNREGEKVKILLSSYEKPGYIDMYRKSRKTGEEVQLRFHLGLQ